MNTYSTIKINAGADSNGNPQRCYVTLHNGSIVAAYDEGYSGIKAITNPRHQAAYAGVVIPTTPATYHMLASLHPPR